MSQISESHDDRDATLTISATYTPSLECSKKLWDEEDSYSGPQQGKAPGDNRAVICRNDGM